MRVEDFLRHSASRLPDKTALVAGAVRLSFADLDLRSDALAAALQEEGVARGDRVIVFMDNCAEMVLAIFAVLKAGAVLVPVNGSTKPHKLARLLADSRPAAIIAQRKLAPFVAEALSDDIAVFLTDTPEFYAALAEAAPLAEIGGMPDDLAMLIYTSGSTGEPKGVMMTHRSVVAAACAINTYLHHSADDVLLSTLPLAFNYGLYQLLTAMQAGAKLVLERNFAFPTETLETMRTAGVTGFPMVPTMAAILLQRHADALSALPHLRYVTNAAAPLPIAHIERLKALLPDVEIVSMYGQTECVRGAWLPPAEIGRRPGSVGIALPGTTAAVLDEAGSPVPPGTVGELVITGSQVMLGYWNKPIETARVLRDGEVQGTRVLRTGDLFYADAEGFLYFVSRKDDILKIRGEKVAPKEVEDALHAIPGVAEAVVVGVPDPLLGTSLRAIVVRSDPSLTERAVLGAAARVLEDFMVPRSIYFRTSLPRTDSGKVSRRLAAQSLELN